MMKQTPSLRDLTSQEYRKFILPAAIAGLGTLLAFLLNVLVDKDISASNRYWLMLLIAISAIYITIYSFYLIPARKNKDVLIWTNAIISGGGLWILSLFIPDDLILYLNLLLFLAVISVSIFAGRVPTLFMIALGTIPHLVHHFNSIHTFLGWAEHIGVPAVAVILNETTTRIQNISRGQVRRLEIINAFSRQVAATLDREQIIVHLNSAIPNALVSDSYYLSVVENDQVHILLCYDDGEYFNDAYIPAEGTLTNWVVKNKKELFLPDLRQPIELEDIKIILVGKDRTSLSWIGVPMISSQFKGVLALASYQPNAFNRGDLELLSNLAQHAVLALENAARHAEVEERARLDSLTGVFNHGYFLQILQHQADDARASGESLSLIMLDVDTFKHYNDTHGHLIGDQILVQLCDAIRSHIKNKDAVGRWGGEEFIIALPGASGAQAQRVAERISQTMYALKITGRAGEPIPPPTVSQGIAVFPRETAEIYKLIELADRRLYTAKNRGRDQIEPPPPSPSLP
jgi:diguanylate cyclase (GGDEF)-like protein